MVTFFWECALSLLLKAIREICGYIVAGGNARGTHFTAFH